MKINESAVAILEKLWVHSIYLIENEGLEKEVYNKTAVEELENLKLIEHERGKLYLTPEGFEETRQIIKMRRLSEKSKKILNEAGMNNELMENEFHNFEPLQEGMAEKATALNQLRVLRHLPIQ